MGRFFNDYLSRFLAILAGMAVTVSSAEGHSPVILPGLQADGSVLLPNQWSLRPVGQQIPAGDFPVNLAVHPSGKFVAVLHCGYSEHEVRIIAGRAKRVVLRPDLVPGWHPALRQRRRRRSHPCF
jgi:hypothetical protein